MAEQPKPKLPTLGVESVSAVFAHDISTPLTTAKMNADLLVEYQEIVANIFRTTSSSDIPSHIKIAIEQAPKLIQNNLKNVQTSLSEYKTYLNSLHVDEIEEPSNLQSDTMQSLRILLVDDEEIHHDIAHAVLDKFHKVVHEYDGYAAIKRCQKEHFDLVLMDMHMPNISGPETTEKLREFLTDKVHIVGLSNMPIHSRKKELIECGFNGFLDKPLKLEHFNALAGSLGTKPKNHEN